MPLTSTDAGKEGLFKGISLRIILPAWLLAGTLDILSACTDFYLTTGKSPFQPVLRYVASGVYGKAAFSADSSIPWMGLLFHYLIALSFTLFFFILYPRIKWMRYSVLLTGLVYGFFMWAFMRFAVLPQSHTPAPAPLVWWKVLKAAIILVLAIGIPLAWIASRQMAGKSRIKG